MGIEPDIEYGANCNACFPAGESPEYVYASFAGIKIGVNWIPAFPPPPNGTFELTNQGGCEWSGGDATYIINWKANQPGTLILATVFLLAIAFSYLNVVSCVVAGDNQIVQPPNRIYHGGSAKIAWTD